MRTEVSRGRYLYPVENGAELISKIRSPAHRGPLRNALDFIVPIGTPVMASADGVVVDLKKDEKIGGDSRRFEKHGNFVQIWHEQYDEYTEYEHLSQVKVQRGKDVYAGSVIGFSGATGWLGGLGPHLHWEVGIYRVYDTRKPRFLQK